MGKRFLARWWVGAAALAAGSMVRSPAWAPADRTTRMAAEKILAGLRRICGKASRSWPNTGGPAQFNLRSANSMRSQSALGLRDAAVELKEFFHLGDIESRPDPIRHSHKRKDPSVPLSADIRPDQDADPGGINVRHAAHIEHERSGSVRSNRVLKLKKVGKSDWSH